MRDLRPDCGGGIVPRPVRPTRGWTGGHHLGKYPAGSTVKHRPAVSHPRGQT